MKGNELEEKKRLDLKNLQGQVAEAALEVQKNFGLGFSSPDYCQALAHELNIRNIDYERDKMVMLSYKGQIAGKHNVDFVVDDRIVLTVMSSEEIDAAQLAKQRSFIKALDFKLGMMVNFAEEKVEIKSVYR